MYHSTIIIDFITTHISQWVEFTHPTITAWTEGDF